MSQPSAAVPAQQIRPSYKLPFVVKAIRECVAITLWLSLTVKAFLFDFDVYLCQLFFPEHLNDLLYYRFFAFLGFLVTLTLPGLFLGRRWFHSFVAYLFIYPFVLLWYAFLLVLFNWPLAIVFAPGIHGLVSQFPKVFVWNSVAILSAFAISAFNSRYVLATAMIFLAVYLCRHYYHDFRRAFKPSSVFTDLAALVQKLRGYAKDPYASSLAKLDPESEKYKSDYRASLEMYLWVYSILQYVSHKFRMVVKSRWLDAYLIVTFVWTLLITVLIFGLLYFALYKIDQSSFVHDELVWHFWDFMGYSFTTLVNGSISPVQATSGIAQTIAHIEVLFAILLLIVVFSLIVAILSQKYREDMDQVTREIDDTVSKLKESVGEHYRITIDDAEQYLILSSLQTVNLMRKLRGLSEITLVSTQQQPAAPMLDVPETLQGIELPATPAAASSNTSSPVPQPTPEN